MVEVDARVRRGEIVDYAGPWTTAGRLIHPTIVDGQVHGATAHGSARALYESFQYDEDGIT